MTPYQLLSTVAATLMIAAASVVYVGCAPGEAREVVTVVRDTAASVEADPAVDEESRAIGGAVREAIDENAEPIEKVVRVVESAGTEGNIVEVAQGVSSELAAQGVPYAALVSLALNGVLGAMAWWNRRKAKTVISNISASGIIDSATKDQKEQLKRVNIKSGVQSLVKSVTG